MTPGEEAAALRRELEYQRALPAPRPERVKAITAELDRRELVETPEDAAPMVETPEDGPISAGRAALAKEASRPRGGRRS